MEKIRTKIWKFVELFVGQQRKIFKSSKNEDSVVFFGGGVTGSYRKYDGWIELYARRESTLIRKGKDIHSMQSKSKTVGVINPTCEH